MIKILGSMECMLQEMTFRQSVNNEGTMVYFSHSGTGDLRGHTLTATGGTFNVRS